MQNSIRPEGLNTLGLLDLMKIHPSIFKESVFFIVEALKGYRLDLPVPSRAVPSRKQPEVTGKENGRVLRDY